jgi:hydroxymethylglutaryl-CoA synthase
MVKQRDALNYQQYSDQYQQHLPTDGSTLLLPKQQKGLFRLAGIENHKRLYERA